MAELEELLAVVKELTQLVDERISIYDTKDENLEAACRKVKEQVLNISREIRNYGTVISETDEG
jgi:Na+/phosphate symporter